MLMKPSRAMRLTTCPGCRFRRSRISLGMTMITV